MFDNDASVTSSTTRDNALSLGESIDFDVRGLGRRLPPTKESEGWIRKADRRRGGKVWIGFFHVWVTGANGSRVRRKKEKTLGPGSMPKHEALSNLAAYIEEFTGKAVKQGNSIETFADLWRAFCAVRSGRWSKKTKEDLRYLFAKHVLPSLESLHPREVSLTSLQLLLNGMAEAGYGTSAVSRIRTYIKACFGYATDEELIEKNPARKLMMPNIRPKPCERYCQLGARGSFWFAGSVAARSSQAAVTVCQIAKDRARKSR